MNTHKEAKLTLHCGAAEVEWEKVESVPTPSPTRTWTPIPHAELVGEVKSALGVSGLHIVKEAHSLTRDGARYFGLFQIGNGTQSEDYSWVLGARNSHDKKFPAGLVVGATVFVCDNLSFSGEIRFARKHTRFIVRDLPALTARAIGQLSERWHSMDERIKRYKADEITDVQAHDLIVRGLKVEACTSRQLPKVLREWENPRHPDFEPRTSWSLFNDFTEVLKECSLAELPKRTERLHGLFDNHVGLIGRN